MAQYIDKDALVAELERRRESNAKEKFFGRLVEDNYFLDFIGTLEVKGVKEEPVSMWHDSSKETPTQGSNVLMFRKKEKDSNYPPIAGCFHRESYPYNKLHWGYYDGFCYNEIEPPVKWAYIDDLLKL